MASPKKKSKERRKGPGDRRRNVPSTGPMDDRRTPYQATVRVDPQAVAWLRGRFNNRFSAGDPEPDGRVECLVNGYSAESLAGELMSFGSYVEVVAPQEVRDVLAEWGRNLVDRYGN